MKRSGLLWLLPLAALAVPAQGAEWFRFENEDGVTVISHYIPPSLVHKGYTVIDDGGNVLRVVPRELTGTELATKRAREAEEKKAQEAQQTRKRKDEELLRLYATVPEVEAARDRKLASIEEDIGRIKADIERLTLQKSRTEAQAADRERRGEPASPELLENIRVIDTQIQDRGRDVQQRRLEAEQNRRNFQYDIERMRMLLGLQPPEAEVPEGDDPQGAGVKTAAASSGH